MPLYAYDSEHTYWITCCYPKGILAVMCLGLHGGADVCTMCVSLAASVGERFGALLQQLSA